MNRYCLLLACNLFQVRDFPKPDYQSYEKVASGNLLYDKQIEYRRPKPSIHLLLSGGAAHSLHSFYRMPVADRFYNAFSSGILRYPSFYTRVWQEEYFGQA